MGKIEVHSQNEVTVVKPAGPLIGGDETMELNEIMEEQVTEGNNRLVLDLSNVPYVNSSGVGTLMAARNLCVRHEGGLAVIGLNPKIESLLQALLIYDLLNCHTDLDEAVTSLVQASPL